MDAAPGLFLLTAPALRYRNQKRRLLRIAGSIASDSGSKKPPATEQGPGAFLCWFHFQTNRALLGEATLRRRRRPTSMACVSEPPVLSQGAGGFSVDCGRDSEQNTSIVRSSHEHRAPLLQDLG
jgi:hypothetical protein